MLDPLGRTRSLSEFAVYSYSHRSQSVAHHVSLVTLKFVRGEGVGKRIVVDVLLRREQVETSGDIDIAS